jgi:DNA-binding NarL/FixJ family response regulator
MANGQRPNGQRPIGVALIDPDEPLRRMLARITQARVEFVLRGCFATAQAALAAIPGLDVEIILSEIALPDLCGLACARRLLAARPELRVVVASALTHPLLIQQACIAGACDYLLKPVPRHQCWASLQFASAQRQPPLKGLAPREREVLELAAAGAIDKEIADRLGIHQPTVRTHWRRIFVKLDAPTRAAAVARFLRFRVV